LVAARRLQAAVGGPLVWIKRDDLTGFATAGNKARSLEFLIGDAIATGCDTLVTGGGLGSNFCAAAAAAARVAHLDCHLVLYGSPDGWHPNLAAARAAGAQVHFTGRPDRDEIDRAVPALAARLAGEGRRPYPMPRGGATPVGARGYIEGYRELLAQLADEGVEPGVIVVATGSGATQAGLVAGLAASRAPQQTARVGQPGAGPPGAGQAGAGQAGRGWRILGATVSRPPGEITATIEGLARQCGPAPAVVEVVDARGPGFGLASAEGDAATAMAFTLEGVVLDPVYTAKAFAVVLRLLADGANHPIVFWHTGGLPAALHHLASERSSLCPTAT
jgi:D-cysteine desulfhydrase